MASSTGLRDLASLWIHRRALLSLALHDLRKSYAATVGGVAWSVLTPLIPILIFSAIFSYGMRLPLGNAPYIFGFAAAYVPWVLLSSSISGAAGSLLEHRHLIKRVVFPVEIIPADPVLVHSPPHFILLLMTGAACAIGGYGRFPQAASVLYFYLCLVAFAVSVAWLVSAMTVVVRDFQQMLPAILNVWFWLTPIAWAPDILPAPARTLLAFNPASYIVIGYRYALMPRVFAPPAPFETAAFWLMTVALLIVSSSAFRRLRIYFWDCL